MSQMSKLVCACLVHYTVIIVLLKFTLVNADEDYYEDYENSWWPPDRKSDNAEYEEILTDDDDSFTYEELNHVEELQRTTKKPPKKPTCVRQTYDIETFFRPLVRYAVQIYTWLYTFYIDHQTEFIGVFRFLVRVYSFIHNYLLQGMYQVKSLLDESTKVMETQQTSLVSYEEKLT